MKKKLILIGVLLLFFASTSTGQSLTERFTIKTPETPGMICAKDQCSKIWYFSGGGVVVAEVLIHGDVFLGWRPPCPYCPHEEQTHAAALALEEQVKHRFPDAKTGY